MMSDIAKQDPKDVQFTLWLLEKMVGGTPALQFSDKGYTLMSMCQCDKCGAFRKGYAPEPSKNILGAVRYYTEAKLAFNQAVLERQYVRTTH